MPRDVATAQTGSPMRRFPIVYFILYETKPQVPASIAQGFHNTEEIQGPACKHTLWYGRPCGNVWLAYVTTLGAAHWLIWEPLGYF